MKMISSTTIWPKLILIFLIIIGGAIAVGAEVIDDIAEDFAPISGYVVMPEGNEYIIDLDETHGISTGDIFSVIAPGKEIVHPVTHKVLGTLETVKGMLKVTRIKTGFSFARPIGKSDNIQRGDPIRRYGNLAAIFWDYTGRGQSFFMRLQKALPDLKWQDYDKSQSSRPPKPAASSVTHDALTFILSDSGIEVRDPDFMVVRSYAYPASLSKTGPAPPAAGSTTGAAAPVVAAVPPKSEPGATTPPATGHKKGEVKSVFPVFSGVQTLSSLPGVSVMTDFMVHGDQLLMASTNGARIQIFDVADGLKLIAESAPAYPVQILSVKWWVPDKGQKLYLAATVWSDRDKKVRGNLFGLNGDSLKPVMENIPRILGTFDLNGDGQPEALFGQEFDGENFFGRRLSELRLSGDKLSYFEPGIQTPSHFPVLGSVFADLTGDGQLETIYIRNRILYVYSGNKRLYKSQKQMGGSLSNLTYDIDPTVKDVQPATVEFEISPVVTDLDGDGQSEIIAVASDRDLLGTLAITPGIKKTWLTIFKYQNGRFASGTLGDELDLPLPGLTVTPRRVLIVATEPGNLLGEGAKSHLLAYSLGQ